MSADDRPSDSDVRALRDSEERFRTILEHAPVMVDSFDEHGTCLLWNRECELRLGWTQDEITRMEDPLTVFYPDREQRDRVLEAITRADGQFREYHVLAKDGSSRIQMWADFRLPTGALISVGHDVTEQRAMESRLRQSQKMEAVGQLTGGIAHDFNNLLTVILANTELISRRMPEDGSVVAQAMVQVREAASRGARLVRQLMSFSRQSRLSFRPVELRSLLDELAPTLRRLLPETIEIGVRAADEEAFIDADPIAIEQIVVNIATNARDAIDGRGRIDISTRLARGHHRTPHDVADYVVLSVEDDGCGMTGEVRDRVFEPFFTTKAHGRGTGLGLPTVYGLVEQHGGFVELTSQPGRGTSVRVWLPLTQRRGSDAGSDDGATGEVVGGTETILVVEDEPGVREAAERALQLLGYRVLSAENGAAALDVLQREPDVALVLSDVVMPRMTGPELLERVRAMKPPVPAFAFMTGYASRESIGVIDGTIPLIEKPWSPAELARFLRHCLGD